MWLSNNENSKLSENFKSILNLLNTFYAYIQSKIYGVYSMQCIHNIFYNFILNNIN